MRDRITTEYPNTVEQAPMAVAQRAKAFVSKQGLEKRIQAIFQSMMKESWLPLSLRGLIAEEIAAIRDELSAGIDDLARFAQLSHGLALSTFTFGDCMRDSDTVRKIRVLDLELNPNALVFAGLLENGLLGERLLSEV